MHKDLIKHSKFLSMVLRHNPSAIGISLDESGWVEVNALVKACEIHRPQVTRERLSEIVATNEKRRFAFSEDGTRIRASQGHSIRIDLGLAPVIPPTRLFHGTAEKNLRSIADKGLLAGKRDHVHLSSDTETARSFGARHGKPVVIEVESGRMADDGHVFHLSENHVWLTPHVPPVYLRFSVNTAPTT